MSPISIAISKFPFAWCLSINFTLLPFSAAVNFNVQKKKKINKIFAEYHYIRLVMTILFPLTGLSSISHNYYHEMITSNFQKTANSLSVLETSWSTPNSVHLCQLMTLTFTFKNVLTVWLHPIHFLLHNHTHNSHFLCDASCCTWTSDMDLDCELLADINQLVITEYVCCLVLHTEQKYHLVYSDQKWQTDHYTEHDQGCVFKLFHD